MEKLKTNKIADIVIKSMAERSFSVFGTTIQGCGLHEADVLGINPTGYIYEYEIKASRSDFRADFKKEAKHHYLKTKDALIQFNEYKNGKRTNNIISYIRIPNRFYYICVEELIKVEDVPEYAGLVWIDEEHNLIEKKTAPLLHRNKANIHLYKRIASILSQRIIYGCSYYTFQQQEKKEANEKLLNS